LKYVMYNPSAGQAEGGKLLAMLKAQFDPQDHVFKAIQSVDDWGGFFRALDPSDAVIICGGDGTLNRFVNAVLDLDVPNRLLYYPCGSGNDFLRDIADGKELPLPIDIAPYIKNLPYVTVNGETHRFLNGVGYGIDGYCCEVGDHLRSKSDKPVDYTGIAIKGVLFHYKPTSATVTVDGKRYHYDRVWIAPTMNGRYYGGGMMTAPSQDRLGKDRGLSLVVVHNASPLKLLCIFPSIFKGGHLKFKKNVVVHRGYDISVAFDRPTTLQIDGETVLNVSEYRALSSVNVKEHASMV